MLKRLKTRLAILAVVALSVISIGAATAQPASAANCTLAAGDTANHAGALKYPIGGSCSGVTKFRYIWMYGGYGSGWWDDTWHGLTWASYLYNGTRYTSDIEVNLVGGIYLPNMQMINECYWHGPPPAGDVHALQPHFYFQIKNAAYPYNWGPVNEWAAPFLSYPACT